VILRGLNVAGNSKVPPFRPIDDPARLDPLPGWGMNVIRLLFTWEAYEPQLGAYDAGYLDYIARTAHAAGDLGLYVIVDFHQDSFSRFLGGCGEGFPSWALPPSVPPATPDNGAACADWGQHTASDPQVKPAWDAFYSDASGVRTRYLAMIARVAGALAGEPAVIGYDLLNEPFGDEKAQIGPLYEDAARALRAADPAAILFVSPAIVTGIGSQTQLQRPSFDNFAYSPHYYDPLVFEVQSYNGSDESAPFALMTGHANAWGVPLFLGEYGAVPATDGVDGYLSAIAHQLDQALASGTQWNFTPGWTPDAKDGWNLEDFSIVDDAGQPRANFRPRPFARRIAGTPVSLAISDEPNPQDNTLILSWQHDPSAGATELYLPSSYFEGAPSLSPDGDVRCTLDGELAHCDASTAGLKQVRAAAPSRCGLTGFEGVVLLALLARRRR
jgi:endoglycosylceramidase